ncbi:hypothetical protein LEP1GSC016_1124 [Leptospira borgpetersenii serovar Hardjo-bovis str. Sponselee]|uniref:Uncharacterized protein n=1 Tax=Leptospira borgpetersenii serovar Hardjo-bovis str. Sponselee TaxID=1303729 RepID=M6BKS2_LEPBO|nr:hypothetical protein LEP1GSC016_1124 [Leptospira borgpetersenii serovar Hardjo-bovis str. Sponselee]
MKKRTGNNINKNENFFPQNLNLKFRNSHKIRIFPQNVEHRF